MPKSVEVSFRIPTRHISYKSVFQFRITLCHIEPAIWRVIQVPESYSFYELHVALQGAMGWEDRHLHVFELDHPKISIECPFAEPECGENIQYWTSEVRLKKILKRTGVSMAYRYDFGDNWLHKVEFEAILPRDAKTPYPRCIDGARACPPEDCGGIGGYARSLEALRKRDRDDEFFRWLGDWSPNKFSVKAVRFEDPIIRFLRSFDEDI